MEPSPSTAEPPRKTPFKVPIIFAPIYVPLLLLDAAASIPSAYVAKLQQQRSERGFTEQMKKAGRIMQWQEFKQAETNGMGTAIGEYLSTKGPFRLWWTPDDIPATSPHKWKREQHVAWYEREFAPFFEWCYARYTNPQSGTGPAGSRSTRRAKSTRGPKGDHALRFHLFFPPNPEDGTNIGPDKRVTGEVTLTGNLSG
jgi:hypothetical protein